MRNGDTATQATGEIGPERWPKGVPGADETDWDAARTLAYGAAAGIGAERAPNVTMPLTSALGRTLADPLLASLPLPGFDTAAMDGYAVRGRPPWLVAGQTLAGEPAGPELPPGHAWEVATGAPVPAGARAVIAYELASRTGELVSSELASDLDDHGGLPAGLNIRRAGEEARPGDVLLTAGTRVTPQVLGLAAALGYDELLVAQRPRLAALITGDELVLEGLPDPGHVRDAIGPALAGLAAAVGGVLVGASYLPDRGEALGQALDTAPAAEFVLVAGSSSVGRSDYLHRCLAERGGSVIVGSVACKPGRTQSLWRLPDGRIVVGLPGNPFAAFVAFLTLVSPCCAGFLGVPLAPLRPVELGMLKAHPSRTRLVPVRLGSGRVEPISHDGSAMLKGLALADALAVVPPGTARGGEVRLLPLPG